MPKVIGTLDLATMRYMLGSRLFDLKEEIIKLCDINRFQEIGDKLEYKVANIKLMEDFQTKISEALDEPGLIATFEISMIVVDTSE